MQWSRHPEVSNPFRARRDIGFAGTCPHAPSRYGPHICMHACRINGLIYAPMHGRLPVDGDDHPYRRAEEPVVEPQGGHAR